MKRKTKEEKISTLQEKRKNIILKGEDYFGDLIQMSPDDIVDFLFVFGEDNNQGWANQNRALTYALRIQEINNNIKALESE